MKKRVLFICIHNSARSQMAATLLNRMAGDRFEAESAGLEPGTLNPLVVEVLGEMGIDISQKETQAVFDVWKSGRIFAYVVTVCSEAEAAGCPIFPGYGQKLNWPFDDPSKFTGWREERLVATRRVRDQVRAKLESWLATTKESLTGSRQG